MSKSPVDIGEEIANATPGNLTQDDWLDLVGRVANVVRAERARVTELERANRSAWNILNACFGHALAVHHPQALHAMSILKRARIDPDRPAPTTIEG